MKLDIWTANFTSSLAATILGGLIVGYVLHNLELSTSDGEPEQLSRPAQPVVELFTQ